MHDGQYMKLCGEIGVVGAEGAENKELMLRSKGNVWSLRTISVGHQRNDVGGLLVTTEMGDFQVWSWEAG